MKRVNKEHISEVLDVYFQKRNFGKGTPTAGSQSVDMISNAVNMAASLETSLVGTINCSAVTDSSCTEAEVQFSRLVLFVKAANEKHKSALMNILFPIFISIYVDMQVGGLKPIAHRFHLMNRPIFNNLPIYKSTMDAIMMVVQKCDKDSGSSLSKMLHAELGENKFNVKFSSATLRYLKNYLMSRENMMILQVFNSNVTVEIDSDDNVLETVSPSASADVTVSNEAAMSRLRLSIDAMHEVVSPLPDIKLHLIDSQQPKVLCGHITNKHIVLGCEDSSLQLLHRHGDLLQLSHPSTNDSTPSEDSHSTSTDYSVDVSRVHLKGDWLEDSLECSAKNGKYEAKKCITMRGHSSEVYSVASFDNSECILSSSADKTIRLWNTESCTNRVIYHGHMQTVWSLATATNSSYFASCSKDRSAKLWTTECIYPLRTYVGHVNSVDCVKFHPNNSYLATAGQDRAIRLWDTQSGKCVRLMQGPRGITLCLAFSPSGSLLASAGEDRRIRLWDLASGEIVKEMRGHTDTVRSLEFNSDGSLLCSGAQDNTIIAWNTRIAGSSTQSFASSPTSDLLASYNSQSQNCSIISIQSMCDGLTEVIGIT